MIKISDLLNQGQGNAIPLRHLVKITGTDGRTIRQKIAAERMSGVPILSDNSTGYYLAANEEEKKHFIQNMQHRAREILKVAASVEAGENNKV